MKLIPHYDIPGEILKLINESENYLVLVSPYVNFKNWDIINSSILNAINRGVKVNFYTRLDYDNFRSWEQIEQLGIKPKLIKNLHAKVYFNEKTGIVTSMNLLASSSMNAIEIASKFQNPADLSELKNFVKSHLEPYVTSKRPNSEEIKLAKEKFHITLSKFLSEKFNRNVKIWWKNGSLCFNINNQYSLNIDKGKNILTIHGITSGLEQRNFNLFSEKFKFNGFRADVGEDSIYIEKTDQLTNTDLNYLSFSEKRNILDMTAKFVNDLSDHKIEVWERKEELE